MLEAEDSKTLQYWLERRQMVGTLVGHSSPPAPGKAQLRSVSETREEQQKEVEREQRRREKERAKGKGDVKQGGAGGEGRADEILQTRIDLFVPGRSQGWLQQNVIKAGIDGQTAYQSLARDPKVLQVLQTAYVRNKAHNGGQQQLLTVQRAASSVAKVVPKAAQPMGHSGG
jgi:hypothetical protein